MGPGMLAAGQGDACVPSCKGSWVLCHWGPALCPGACWHLSPLFQPSRWKVQGKKVVLPAPGHPAHSKIPACKCSWQLFRQIRMCQEQLPRSGKGWGEGRRPGCAFGPWPGSSSQEQAAKAGSDPGSAHCRPGEPLTGLWPLRKTLLPSAGLAPSPRHGCTSGTWTTMLSSQLGSWGGPPWEHGDGYCGGAQGGFLVLGQWPEATRSPSPTPSPCPTAHPWLWPPALVLCLWFASQKIHLGFALQHGPGSQGGSAGQAALPCLPWGCSTRPAGRQGPLTRASGAPSTASPSPAARTAYQISPRDLHEGEKQRASVEAAVLNISAENHGFPWLATAQPGGHFHSQAINLANGGF